MHMGRPYGRRLSGDELHLWCFNKEHFQEKMANGKEAFAEQFKKQRKEQGGQDLALAKVIESKLGDDPQLAVAISTALLIAQDRFFRLTPAGQRSMQEFRYNPITILELAETLDVKIETGGHPNNEPCAIDATDAIHALESVAGVQAASVSGLLMAWLARASEVESNGENPGLSVTDMSNMFQTENEIEGRS